MIGREGIVFDEGGTSSAKEGGGAREMGEPWDGTGSVLTGRCTKAADGASAEMEGD